MAEIPEQVTVAVPKKTVEGLLALLYWMQERTKIKEPDWQCEWALTLSFDIVCMNKELLKELELAAGLRSKHFPDLDPKQLLRKGE